MPAPHTSVLLHEILGFFRDLSLHCFVDATLGAGGHSEAILTAHPEIGLLIGIDQDPLAREIAENRLAPWKGKTALISGNFSRLTAILSEINAPAPDGILFDLGVSSMQFDRAEKGFSLMREGPLDMRMDPSSSLTAEEIVNSWSEAELGRIFREYGEEKQWRRAARALVQARKNRAFRTTTELALFISRLMPVHKKGIHPATLIFQALRMAVNGELEALKMALPMAIDALASGGRLGVISFHSLEDRIVKEAMRFYASDKINTSGIGGLFLEKEPIVRLITKKPVIAGPEELTNNPRSRSAKLRIVEKR